MPSTSSRLRTRAPVSVLAGLALVLALVGAAGSEGSGTPGRVISGPSPFDGCSGGGLDGLFANAEVEPSLAVDPRDPRRLIVAYQQDRFSTGAARGLIASSSTDGGRNWARTELPFSLCAGGQTTGWQRASDPWVSIGPDGRAYLIGLGSGIAVSTSTDGGRRWSVPVTLAANNSTYLVDKCTVTADPAQAGVAYAVWQRYLRRRDGPPIESDTLLSVTRDGGRRWSAPRLVLAHTRDTGDVASVVLPGAGGALFHLAYRQAGGVPGPGARHLSTLLVQRSGDGGRTWTTPRRIARIRTTAAKLRDPGSGNVIRSGVPSFALGSGGRLFAVWQDSRFGGGSVDQVAFSRSADGGRTWTKPRRLDVGRRVLGVVPTVAAAGSVVGVSYYTISPGPNAHDAQAWVAVSRDSGKTFTRRAVGPAFALGDAPLLAGDPSLLVPPGLFVGDYTGLAVRRSVVYAAFPTANQDSGNPTDVRFVGLPAR
jgi:hypothetical protein